MMIERPHRAPPSVSSQVEREIARTDDGGKAIHPECYVLRLKLKRATSSSEE
jgi:hypothetical protein